MNLTPACLSQKSQDISKGIIIIDKLYQPLQKVHIPFEFLFLNYRLSATCNSETPWLAVTIEEKGPNSKSIYLIDWRKHEVHNRF